MARPHGGWKRDEDDLVALAVNLEHSVAVFLTKVLDVAAGGLEDAQPQQPEHSVEREVASVGRVLRGGE